MATTKKISYGAWTSLACTALQSLAIDTADPFNGWQSPMVSNLTDLALDVQVQILLSVAATTPANDKIVYAYVVPWDYNGSSVWTPAANFGTANRPNGTDATCVISDPNSMKGPRILPYKVISQPFDDFFTIAQMCGIMPPGWSLAIRNNCGAALGTGCVISYRNIFYTDT